MHPLSLIICCFLLASIVFMIPHGMAAHRILAEVPSDTRQNKGLVHGSHSGTAPSEGQVKPPPPAAHNSPASIRKPVCYGNKYNCRGAGKEPDQRGCRILYGCRRAGSNASTLKSP